MIMEKEFVPFELAVKLKELGFDQPCLCFYFEDNTLRSSISANHWIDFNNSKSCNGDDNNHVSAPLWQQGFDWFRDKYKMHYVVRRYVGITDKTQELYEYMIQQLKGCGDWKLVMDSEFYNYEQARKHCLEKLIEIVQPTQA